MSPKKVKFESVVGKHQGRSGSSEDVYECTQCRKPKLYKNRETGKFICFVCGYTGCDAPFPGAVSSARKSESLNLSAYKQTFPSEIRKRGYTISSLPEGLFYFSPDHSHIPVLIPLFTQGELKGAAGYSCSGYHNIGTRGIAIYTGERGPNDRFDFVHIYEGFFDWLAGISANYCPISNEHQRRVTPLIERSSDHALIFTGGNQLSTVQRLDILRRTKQDGKILVCFDSDQPHKAYNVVRELEYYRRTLPLLPPEPYKDWDDCYHGRG